VRIEELEAICRDAAAQLVERGERPVPASVVLPLPAATRVVTLPDFPADDAGRFALLSDFAEDEMRPANAPCYGFVAEGTATAGQDVADVVVVVFGARGHQPRIVAAQLHGGALGSFGAAEDLHPGAMPFLAPLQQAADAATPPDVMDP
jgi:hypothetical protein